MVFQIQSSQCFLSLCWLSLSHFHNRRQRSIHIVTGYSAGSHVHTASVNGIPPWSCVFLISISVFERIVSSLNSYRSHKFRPRSLAPWLSYLDVHEVWCKYIIGPGEPLHSTIYYQLYDFQMHGTSLKVRGECGICRLNLFITLNVAWSSIWYSDFIATITCLFRSFIVWSRCYHYDGFNTHALCDVIGVGCCIFFQFSMLHCLRLLR